ERAQACAIFAPNAQVLELVDLTCRVEQGVGVAPIRADKVDGAARAVAREEREHALQEAAELCFAHLPAGHGKLAVHDGALAADMALDGHVIGRIGEHHLRGTALQQPLIARRLERIAAQQAMAPERPEVTGPLMATAAGAGGTSIASPTRLSGAAKLSMRRSISPIKKPVSSTLKSRSSSANSWSCSASSRSSHTANSARRLSASWKARAWAALRCSSRIVGSSR